MPRGIEIEPVPLEFIVGSVARVAREAPSASAHELLLLIDELDVLAECLVGRHDEPSVAQKAVVQGLVHQLCPERDDNPPASTSA